MRCTDLGHVVSNDSIALLGWQRQRGVVVLSLFLVVVAAAGGEEGLLKALPQPKFLESPRGRRCEQKGKGERACDRKEDGQFGVLRGGRMRTRTGLSLTHGQGLAQLLFLSARCRSIRGWQAQQQRCFFSSSVHCGL